MFSSTNQEKKRKLKEKSALYLLRQKIRIKMEHVMYKSCEMSFSFLYFPLSTLEMFLRRVLIITDRGEGELENSENSHLAQHVNLQTIKILWWLKIILMIRWTFPMFVSLAIFLQRLRLRKSNFLWKEHF